MSRQNKARDYEDVLEEIGVEDRVSVAGPILEILGNAPSWMRLGECTKRPDLDVTHPPHFEQIKEECCSRCPVRDNCLELGVSTESEEGIFGGEDIYDYMHPIDPTRDVESDDDEAEVEDQSNVVDPDDEYNIMNFGG